MKDFIKSVNEHGLDMVDWQIIGSGVVIVLILIVIAFTTEWFYKRLYGDDD